MACPPSLAFRSRIVGPPGHACGGEKCSAVTFLVGGGSKSTGGPWMMQFSDGGMRMMLVVGSLDSSLYAYNASGFC